MRPIEFESSVQGLLSSCHLPTGDLSSSSKVLLFGHSFERALTGVVGLELYGSDALLRSLAVTESQRGSGLGAALVSHAEKQAVARGAQAVYLLTTTASEFFERLGYSHTPRSAAPVAIASTSQFSELCPSSAEFMVKRLDG